MDSEMLHTVLQMLGMGLGAIVLLMIVAKVMSMIHVDADITQKQLDSAEADVTGKRMLVENDDGAAKTTYYMTFQRMDGSRMEMTVSGEDYGMAAEGDHGVLVTRGDEFVVFKRMN